MRIEYQHHLTREEAYRRIDDLVSYLQKKYACKIRDLKTSWDPKHTRMEFSVKILGFGAEGQLTSQDGQVSLEGKLPFIARLLSGKIEEIVRKKFDEILT